MIGSIHYRLAVAVTVGAMLAACATRPSTPPPALPEGTRAQIGVLETTDLHSNVMSYDYYKLTPDPNVGLERTATLIRAARHEFDNSLLFDAGDTIQGTPLADYQALVARPHCDQELAIYKAMDTLDYDAGTIGNHEFNYGLDFLSQVTGTPFDVAGVPVEKCKGPDYPFVLSNVFSIKSGKPLYAPWRVLTRNITVHTPDGSTRQATIRIGLLGFTPPPIMDWDRLNLQGKVRVMPVVDAAKKYLPEVRKAGADIVIAIVHGGMNAGPYTPDMENASWYLSEIPGIDVMLLGHSHQIFPDPANPKSHYAHMSDVDNVHGFVHGVPAVMGDFYGKALGVIDLALDWHDGQWQVDRSATHSQVRRIRKADGTYVAPDEKIASLVKPEHEATIAYVNTPIGRSDFAMSTYFAAAGDVSALQIVNMAQRDYVQKYIAASLAQYADIPVISGASPFKAGFGGANDYTDIPAGTLAIRNAADLYLFANTLAVVKTDGAGIRAWLEQSADWFNRIDPADSKPQELINSRFPSYNFDVLQGDLSYAIDITKPRGQRIVNLRFKGTPVRNDQAFIVATNNYRANGGGRFPGLDGHNVIFSSPDTNRSIVIKYIESAGTLTRARYGSDRNWHFVKTKTAGPVVFTSAAGKLPLARAAGISGVTLQRNNSNGSATYAIDLSH
ncbi:MAG TPA: bifunctional 2',3'-cyclic-nucleotide 2'-phosphodiesterase/3'-nucleotidase [Rudaea sp.]|nr:bifunctional 2',3'-cyclic-nucleotide 2'-phosphodiesterase/3'-nucleotidase [Rudaea sp.]